MRSSGPNRKCREHFIGCCLSVLEFYATFPTNDLAGACDTLVRTQELDFDELANLAASETDYYPILVYDDHGSGKHVPDNFAAARRIARERCKEANGRLSTMPDNERKGTCNVIRRAVEKLRAKIHETLKRDRPCKTIASDLTLLKRTVPRKRRPRVFSIRSELRRMQHAWYKLWKTRKATNFPPRSITLANDLRVFVREIFGSIKLDSFGPLSKETSPWECRANIARDMVLGLMDMQFPTYGLLTHELLSYAHGESYWCYNEHLVRRMKKGCYLRGFFEGVRKWEVDLKNRYADKAQFRSDLAVAIWNEILCTSPLHQKATNLLDVQCLMALSGHACIIKSGDEWNDFISRRLPSCSSSLKFAFVQGDSSVLIYRDEVYDVLSGAFISMRKSGGRNTLAELFKKQRPVMARTVIEYISNLDHFYFPFISGNSAFAAESNVLPHFAFVQFEKSGKNVKRERGGDLTPLEVMKWRLKARGLRKLISIKEIPRDLLLAVITNQVRETNDDRFRFLLIRALDKLLSKRELTHNDPKLRKRSSDYNLEDKLLSFPPRFNQGSSFLNYVKEAGLAITLDQQGNRLVIKPDSAPAEYIV